MAMKYSILGRPLLVWVIFAYAVYIGVIAAWATFRIAVAQPGDTYWDFRSDYSSLGLVVGFIPAAVIVLAGVSIFLLKKWAIWLFGLVIVILGLPVLHDGPAYFLDRANMIWLAIASAAAGYAILLRHRGVLS
jgi:hypothetical protein